IDEAGARVRLKSMTKPPDLTELERDVDRINAEKDEAVRGADYERAAELRDKSETLKSQKIEMKKRWRDRIQEFDGEVDEEIIAEVVSSMTGIPLMRMEKDEIERLLQLEAELHRKVVSQDEAVKAIARAVRRSRSGLKDPNRPMGSFIFVGPSGVGKTYLGKCLAEFMFGDPDALMILDMSEYMEKHNVSRLVGAPPGYVGYEEGGQLTERIRRRPYSVVLFDEIEKAHPDVFNMLLQIMEEGRLTDSFGRYVDFKNTIIIMTSNVGAAKITHETSFGFQRQDEDVNYAKMKETLQGELENHFRPEFINRLDEIVVFHKLVHDDLVQIIDLEVAKLASRLRAKGLELELTDEAKDFLIDRGTDEKFGARPLRRAIEQYVEDPLSEAMLRDSYAGKNRVVVSVRPAANDDDLPMLVFEGLLVAGDKPDDNEAVGAGADVADAT
ncbi:MAG: ATP-dependent Clp protease ATP-binding subunit, partial [Phycisphaerales bacterium]|nr:ATP-dependent Clp protease ATP-binding subunit [Phycisphaerales bacterium]